MVQKIKREGLGEVEEREREREILNYDIFIFERQENIGSIM